MTPTRRSRGHRQGAHEAPTATRGPTARRLVPVENEGAGDAPGQGLHELSILGLDKPLADDDLDQLLDDPQATQHRTSSSAPSVAWCASSAGFEGYLYLDLDPGVPAVDFMPDPGSLTCSTAT